MLPLVVLIQQCSVLVVLRRHDLEEGCLSFGEPGRPRAAKGHDLVAACCVVVGCALTATKLSRGLGPEAAEARAGGGWTVRGQRQKVSQSASASCGDSSAGLRFTKRSHWTQHTIDHTQQSPPFFQVAPPPEGQKWSSQTEQTKQPKTKNNATKTRKGEVVLYHLPQNSMRQLVHFTRCPPPSGTIQLPHSGLTQGTAPVDSSPLRVSSVLHVSKARLSLCCSTFAASVLPPLPASLAHEYVFSRNTCGKEDQK